LMLPTTTIGLRIFLGASGIAIRGEKHSAFVAVVAGAIRNAAPMAHLFREGFSG
jgi:hypothetical protein